jgi:tight adherence protein C
VILTLAGIALFAGCALLLAELRWFSRRRLSVRLAPYVPGGTSGPIRQGMLSVGSFREAVGPIARALGGRFSRLFGSVEDLDRRLARIHSDLDVTAFRIRQIGWSIAGFGAGAVLTLAVRPPAPLAIVFTFGGLVLAFLLVERQVTVASDRWKRAVRSELPVVAEQLGMLLTSGYSLVAALDRVARRGHGTLARDLSRTLLRIRQGVPAERALREWSDLADVDAVGRLVAVLAMNREASDLGRLIANEARAIRRDVQRELIVTIERRGQQVWIPVTVAALLPGAIFIGIPFAAALRGFLG